MIEYRINRRSFNKTSFDIPVTSIQFFDFNKFNVEVESETFSYNGENNDKTMLVCACDDIDDIMVGSQIRTTNTLTLGKEEAGLYLEKQYVFNNYYTVSGVNEGERSFSFLIDNFYPLNVSSIRWTKINLSTEDEETETVDDVYMYCSTVHYFDNGTEPEMDEQEETDVDERKKYNIQITFRYTGEDDSFKDVTIPFRYYDDWTLTTRSSFFEENGVKLEVWNLMFGWIEQQEGEFNARLDEMEVLRDNFMFGDKCVYEFFLEKALASVDIPLSNGFETNLLQTEILNEHFVEYEKKKAINPVVDIEKDVYYPSIYWSDTESNTEGYIDVQKIKFNLHFREHRGSDWLVENGSYWNGCGTIGTGEVYKVNEEITRDDASDLLGFLGFSNEDVHFQKNRLKKSFLRLSYYDSTNPANQNLLGFSTIFFNSGELFAKYIKNFEGEGYTEISSENFGEYHLIRDKNGIRVNREHNFDEEKRLSSQLVVQGKNTSKSSSDGFYIYIWKDNETTLPQDLYVKAEFNHAGYGRVIPLMAPFVDNKKHSGKVPRFKSFNEIYFDFRGYLYNSEYEALSNDEKMIYANGWVSKCDCSDFKTQEEYIGLSEENKSLYEECYRNNNDMTIITKEKYLSLPYYEWDRYTKVWRNKCDIRDVKTVEQYNGLSHDEKNLYKDGWKNRYDCSDFKSDIDYSSLSNDKKLVYQIGFLNRNNRSDFKTNEEFDELTQDEQTNYVQGYRHTKYDFTNGVYDGPYGMKQYMKYSYIHLKYCYDKDSNVHRYYLDPDTYGEIDPSNNELVINLYEAKIA